MYIHARRDQCMCSSYNKCESKIGPRFLADETDFIFSIMCILGMPPWNGPMLEDKQRFSDSSFSASASAGGHSPSDARLSTGNSWCAPASDEKHYVQIDFGRRYRIYYFLTYGDKNSPKWVTKYYLNYTTNLIKWKTLTRVRNRD